MKARIAKKIFKLLEKQRKCKKWISDWGFCKFYHGYCNICPLYHDRLYLSYSLHQQYIAAKTVVKLSQNRIKRIDKAIKDLQNQ